MQLTKTQEGIIQRRYQAYAQLVQQAQEARHVLDDLCTIIAGPGSNLSSEDGRIRLDTWEETMERTNVEGTPDEQVD